ncbi:MAG: transporter substrate-binding domain-containing protein, partial [Deltaproteobacteria bacterium]|nr:transporter substrate-binding domain-containing protein [Deltaproteobacteria bacterium]
MKKGKLLVQALLIAGILLITPQQLIAQAARPEGTGETMLEQVLKRGVLRVGMSTFVPWAMQDKSGNFVGFEIDVANRLAQDMGVKA